MYSTRHHAKGDRARRRDGLKSSPGFSSEQGAEHNQVGHPKKHAKKGHEAKVGKGKSLP
jgi:hypothetical protein